MLTPTGKTMELKEFFINTATIQEDGTEIAQHSIIELMESIIMRETVSRVYSDEQLSQYITRAGFEIERRTIAKYREEANIPNSRQRRRELQLRSEAS